MERPAQSNQRDMQTNNVNIYVQMHCMLINCITMENSNVAVEVRKGSWTKDEDLLLTKCIQHYGEGKWHLVPIRAELKRCRKSCRMRWLNYLRPNLKKGYFGRDEVDLLLRLHKLLGNKWSLIAGRLPGRTPNDVKNFWNSHIGKKPKIVSNDNPTTTSFHVIKPRPRNLTMSRSSQQILLDGPDDINNVGNLNIINHASSSSSPCNPTQAAATVDEVTNQYGLSSSSSPLAQVDEEDEFSRWWRDLLQMTEDNQDFFSIPY